MVLSPTSRPSTISPRGPLLANKICNQNTCVTASMTCYFWRTRHGNCSNPRCKYAHYWIPGMRIADKPQRIPGLNRAVAGRNLTIVEAAAAATERTEAQLRAEAGAEAHAKAQEAARQRDVAELEVAKQELERTIEEDAFAALALGRWMQNYEVVMLRMGCKLDERWGLH